MVNPDHLDILEQGGDVWNQWPIDNPDAQLGLRGGTFRDIDFSGINLSNSNLNMTKFEGMIDLSNANFVRARLDMSSLGDVDFVSANLESVNFQHTVLTATNFSGANLTLADLTMARLDRAGLRAATLMATNFTSATSASGRILPSSSKS